MHGKFVSHDTTKSVSASNMMQYLDKENEEAKIKNQHLILEGRADDINPHSVENFFNENFNANDLNDPNSNIDVYTASQKLDENRGTQKLDSSNFFMLALNPSQKELEHMQKIAIDELNDRGLNYEHIKDDPLALDFYNEQLDQIMKLQLKLYTTDIMDNYAAKMDREIYANQELLPDNAKRKEMNPEIERRINEVFIEKGIIDKQEVIEKIEVEFDKKLETNIKSGNAFSVKDGKENYIVYLPNDKFEELENNKLSVNKDYLNEKLEEQKGLKNGTLSKEKIEIEATIDKEIKGSSQITIKPNNYSEEVKLWVNNKDFTKTGDGKIEIEKYKADKLIFVAIERDKEQKKIVNIDYSSVTEKEINAKDSKEQYKILTFNQKVKGLSEPITFTFKESELTKKDNQYFVEKFKLDYRIEKARQNGINVEFGNEKEKIKHEVWQENGFDTSKRKIERKDLMYFAKVETERTYSHNDKAVIKNKPILTQIKKYENSKNPLDKLKIGKLEKGLLRDFYTKEIIDEGLKKGGLNYHTHIIISRHDKTSVNPRDKVSMSPNANQKVGNLNNGAKVGFNRDSFYQDAQDIFDKKFNYQRPDIEKYSELKNRKKGIKEEVADKATDLMKSQIKNEILKHTGMNIVKNELLPIQNIKTQIMPLPIPTSLPKSTLDLVVKVVKMAKNLIVDKGMQY